VDNDRTGAGRTGGTRVTQREAADQLGISVEAIRKRVKRGTLRSDKGEDGRRHVYLDTDPDAGGPQPDGPALTSELRDRLHYVEQQLEAERQAHAEARRIIAGLVERLPQLEAPTDDGPDVPQGSEHESVPERSWLDYSRFFTVLAGIASIVSVVGTLLVAGGGFTYAIISALNGNQIVSIVSALIGFLGSIGAALIPIFLSRRRGNQ